MQRINAGLVIPDNLRHAYVGCAAVLIGCFALFLLSFAFGSGLIVVIAPLAFFGICFTMCGLACVNSRVINWYRERLGALLAQENQVYAGRVPPVRWVGEEYSVITSISVSRSGARTNRQICFDIVVEIGQNVQQGVTVIHQHVYAAPGSPQQAGLPMSPFAQQPPPYGQQQLMQPQYGYAQQPGPQYAQPQYAQPQYAQPQYGQPQYAQQQHFMQPNPQWSPAPMLSPQHQPHQPQQPQPQQQTASEGLSTSLLDSASASDD